MIRWIAEWMLEEVTMADCRWVMEVVEVVEMADCLWNGLVAAMREI